MTNRGNDRERDLRATAEDIRTDARRLEEIERTKTRLGADDPGLSTLTEEAVALVHELDRKTAAERDLTRESTDR